MSGIPQLLISDDDQAFRETLRDVFEPRGFSTVLAADGEEAVQIVRRETIHVVLIDFHMPRLNGAEAIQRIKQFHATVPCILISASEEAEENSGIAFSVLKKPVTRRQVTDMVHYAMTTAYDWYKAV